MRNDISPLAVAEYRALRDTIQRRGSLRLLVIVVTFVSWVAVALSVIVQASPTSPLLSLLSLGVLAAGFEVVFATHLGAERIGCYLQVFYEDADQDEAAPPRWERTVKAVAAAVPAPGIDALASRLFTLATLLNLAPALLAGAASVRSGDAGLGLGLAGVMLMHAALLGRLSQAARFAGRQRELDLAAFREQRVGTPD